MANMIISDRLRKAREKAGFSQRDVYSRLGVKQSRFSAWENGKSEPEIRIFLKLCRLYGIEDIYGFFTEPEGVSAEKKHGSELSLALAKLRELHRDGEAFRRVRNCLDYEYGNYLSKQKEEASDCVSMDVPVYLQPAAAGLGNYMSDDGAEIMHLKAPKGTDAGIRISGDSMEPKIADGDIVFIKYMPYVQPGEVGIFVYGGEAYCKKLDYAGGRPCLVSLNPKYSPIFIGPEDELRTVGKVLF